MSSYLADDVITQIVKDQSHNYNIDFRERLLNFAVTTLKSLRNIPDHRELEVIKYQLSKSATSIGANYEEAQSSSYKEFGHKTRIALREANETKYWLKILDRLDIGENIVREKLLQEIDEISRILGSIVSKVDKKLKSKD
jgi:four helix bundle protein